MSMSVLFARVLFVLMSIFFLTTYTTSTGGMTPTMAILGVFAGSFFAFSFIGLDFFFKRWRLRTFNIAVFGLFCGYLLGEAIYLIFDAAIQINSLFLTPETNSLLRLGIFLSTAYLGLVMAIRSSDELYISIPFIKFQSTTQKKKDLLVDISALLDSRIIDLASSGLLDNTLIIPRFLVKELNNALELNEETQKIKGRRGLDALRKLEAISNLDLRYIENDFPELDQNPAKLMRLARQLDVNILTADLNRVQQPLADGIRLINIHFLANALKPITQSGEVLQIKVQRYGKEPRQGVGYLEDGTMVVVNGGAEYIGETIKAQVLSVKHTSSGRMIFCNASEEGLLTSLEIEQSLGDLENAHKNYFAV